MDTRILQATTLARMGLDDDQIAQVLRIKEIAKTDAPAVDAAPLFAPARGQQRQTEPKGRARHYVELLAAIRRKVLASGPVEASARDLCSQNRDEWMQARRAMKKDDGARESAHGLAGVITHARWASDGIVGRVRFTFLRFDHGKDNSRRGGNGTAIYRVEAV